MPSSHSQEWIGNVIADIKTYEKACWEDNVSVERHFLISKEIDTRQVKDMHKRNREDYETLDETPNVKIKASVGGNFF